MRKLLLSITAIVLIVMNAAAYTRTYHVAQAAGKYVTQKIWLDAYQVPKVEVSGMLFDNTRVAPDSMKSASPEPIVRIGQERKRPFAMVSIPAYGIAADGKLHPVTDYDLSMDMPAAMQAAAKSTYASASSSVLATGTWYKIAVTKTGLYKLDYSFIQGLGVDPTTVSPSTMRVFGNGGHMLSENNAVTRQDDLAENAILMNDGGDGAFGQNDYAIFYAVGPLEWDKDSLNQGFIHRNNLYTDTAYYFINFDLGQPGLRVSTQPGVLTGNVTVTDFNDYAVHDTDALNPIMMGKTWYGEQFSPTNTTQTIAFNFGSAITTPVNFRFSAAAMSASGSTFTFKADGTAIASTQIASASSDTPIQVGTASGSATAANSQSLSIDAIYASYSGSSDDKGFLDYIEINLRRQLSISGSQLCFRDWKSVGGGNIATYQLQGATVATQVWDVTNPLMPVVMDGSNNNGTYSFTQDASMLHEFAAMNSTDLLKPSYSGKVTNQNLHGAGQPTCLIVTYPDFLDAANSLADFHRQNDGMTVLVATTTQIYNEFSSGMQDISAIRDFARMFYKRAGNDSSKFPRYMILFGGASYDYKNRVAANSNYVPVFETAYSLGNDYTFLTDDFYGFLDDNENLETSNIINTLDIGIGRLPVRSLDDANYMVNKIKVYKGPASLGNWRIATINVGDVEDVAGPHLTDADMMTDITATSAHDLYNSTKIFLDAVPKVTTPAGQRVPNANTAFNAQIFNGAFLVNYSGHGNQYVWSKERILTQEDWNSWTNAYKLPITVTATCEFGQFDQPGNISGAEQLVIKKDGGVIAAITATRPVYEGDNKTLNLNYIKQQFVKNNGAWNTLGEAYRLTKNDNYDYHTSGSNINFFKFVLLGDPALVPDFPQYDVHIDTIKDGATQLPADSISALGAYVLKGSVRDDNNNILTDFNGNISVSFYDKPSTTTVTTFWGTKSFNTQNNIIYKGKATVKAGLFSVSFIAPKDINYAYGKGKISTYVDNGTTDGAGADSSFTVGGFSDNPVLSTTPPVVQPYMNDSNFVNGGITGANSVLFAKLTSETGINVSGNDLGHNLIAVLDGNTANTYILNDYYETAPDTYQAGYLSFPVTGLADGSHSIMVRAWDVNNNESEATVDFTVANGTVADIQNLINYPNPFSDQTHFVFEQNHPNEQMTVQIAVYNSAGAFVRMINSTFTPSGSRTADLSWDGTDNNGARLPSGVYVYRLCLTTAAGIKSTAYQKLVISR